MIQKAVASIQEELDAWKQVNRTACLWWRDDDAARDCPELERLLEISSRHRIPCNLAVIPAAAENSLRERLSHAPLAWVLQHGYAHVNHAPRGQGSGAWELGLHRPMEAILQDLHQGRECLEAMFPDRFVPVVVPPWNRMAPEVYPHLARLGMAGVSAEWKPDPEFPAGGVRSVPAHVDLLRWKGKQARFAGAEKVAGTLVEHLRRKRLEPREVSNPTGILTHHLEMDEDAWSFMDTLAQVTRAHGACRWLSAREIFGEEDA